MKSSRTVNNHNLMILAYKYPITYLTSPYHQQVAGEESKVGNILPTIVDIGCGYGGLMFELSKEFPD